MKIIWYGHACVMVETNKTTLLVDPFLTGNATAPIGQGAVNPEYILLTHGHGDHVGDTIEIAKRTEATVVANYEICNWLLKQGVKNTHAQHIGGGFDYPWGRLKLTMALHGSAMPDGSYGGNPCGLLMTAEGKTIYHAGDTGLFSDMKLIGDAGVDLAILPIGDNFTMGPADALKAVEFIRPKHVIPIHFGTFPVIAQDPVAWAAKVESSTGSRVTVLTPGTPFVLS